MKPGASLTALTVMVKVCAARGVDAAVGRAAVVVKLHRHGRAAVGVGGRACRSACRSARSPAASRTARCCCCVTMKLSVWPASLAGTGARWPWPSRRRVCGPASSCTVWSAPLVKLGASLTALTVMVKVWAGEVSTPPLAVPPLSWIVHRHRGAAVGVGGRRVGQRAVRGDRRLRRERARCCCC